MHNALIASITMVFGIGGAVTLRFLLDRNRTSLIIAALIGLELLILGIIVFALSSDYIVDSEWLGVSGKAVSRPFYGGFVVLAVGGALYLLVTQLLARGQKMIEGATFFLVIPIAIVVLMFWLNNNPGLALQQVPGGGPVPIGSFNIERVFPNIEIKRMTNLIEPDDGQNQFLVTKQNGLILSFDKTPDASEITTFLDITGRVESAHTEEGLLGLAFDPDYKSNGYFYVYSTRYEPRRSAVSRFKISSDNPKKADPDSELVLLEVGQPAGDHNAGQLVFGPDGFLYIGLGEGKTYVGGEVSPAQDLSSLLGTILRIDVSQTSETELYQIPPDNPFVNVPDARGEIWAYGFRNPWRFSFDPETGLLIGGDVGDHRREEINLIKKGRNYGWDIMVGLLCVSGTDCYQEGLQTPLLEYAHDPQHCAVIGGFVYRGTEIPNLYGTYVFSDWCSRAISGLRTNGEVMTEAISVASQDNVQAPTSGEFKNQFLFATSFGQDLAGNIYMLDNSGGIFRLVP